MLSCAYPHQRNITPSCPCVYLRCQVERAPHQQQYQGSAAQPLQQQLSGAGRGERLTAVRLESLLHLSIQMSSVSSDPFKDDLGCEFR
jgi:hypothetical protein